MKLFKKAKIDQSILDELEIVETLYLESHPYIKAEKSAWYCLQHQRDYIELKKNKRFEKIIKLRERSLRKQGLQIDETLDDGIEQLFGPDGKMD